MISTMSLQAKGMLAFAVLMVYAAGLTLFVLDQKEALIAEVEQLRSVYERDEAISQADLATLRTLQNLRTEILVQSESADTDRLRDQLARVRSLYKGLPLRYPEAETTLLSLQGALRDVVAEGLLGHIITIDRIGTGPAMWMALTGDRIEAEHALRLGLVSEVVADEQLMPRAREIAALLATKPPLALRDIKLLVRDRDE